MQIRAWIGYGLLVGYGVLGGLVIWIVLGGTNDVSTEDSFNGVVMDLGVVPVAAGPGQVMTTSIETDLGETSIEVHVASQEYEGQPTLLWWRDEPIPDVRGTVIALSQTSEMTKDVLIDVVAFIFGEKQQVHGYAITELVSIEISKETLMVATSPEQQTALIQAIESHFPSIKVVGWEEKFGSN